MLLTNGPRASARNSGIGRKKVANFHSSINQTMWRTPQVIIGNSCKQKISKFLDAVESSCPTSRINKFVDHFRRLLVVVLDQTTRKKTLNTILRPVIISDNACITKPVELEASNISTRLRVEQTQAGNISRALELFPCGEGRYLRQEPSCNASAGSPRRIW